MKKFIYYDIINNMSSNELTTIELIRSIKFNCDLISKKQTKYNNNELKFLKYKLLTIENLSKDILYRIT